MSDGIIAFKGFDQNFQCRGFQYEVGKTYTHNGPVKTCKSGFHACEFPLDVFCYYPPSTSRFALTTLSGEIDCDGGGTKFASALITVTAELSLPDFIKRAVDWIVTNAKSHESNTGDWSAATNTGDRSAATNTGYQSAATISGIASVAASTGYASTVRAERDGCALLCVERGLNGEILSAASGITGKDGVKSGIAYWCKGGRLVEAEGGDA